MKILLTGSSGRVGSAIYARLCRQHEITGFDLLPAPSTQIIGDVTDLNALKKALRGVDAVIHTAALHAPHVGLRSNADFERINVAATRNLLELAAESGVKQLIFTSTTALYGTASTPPNKAGWIDESVKPQPKTIYHRSKLSAENLLELFAERHNFKVIALRMSRCFPEPAPIMASYRLHRGVDARDVAESHALALETPLLGFHRYVISGATPFHPEDTQALLHDPASVLRCRAPELADEFSRRNWPLPLSIDRVYSAELAHRELNWRAKYGFAEVLKMLDEGSPEVLPVGHRILTDSRD